jgi:site-specific DNA-adenine methylase
MNDINKDLILMWKALKKGWKPPRTCSKKNYERLKVSKKHSKERGFFGVSCAYSGIFFAGYRLKDKTGQNFFKRSRDGLIGMSKYLKNIKFLSKSYTDFKPKGMTIYCDPPYKGNKFNSEHFDDFDHREFWDTMRRWSRNNLVIISEYSAPKDFKIIWKKETNSTYNSNSKKRVEKLFVLRKTGGRPVLPKKASLGV